MTPRRLSIFGLGYVGSVSAACFAKMGHHILGVDVEKHKLENMKRGKTPVLEEGLEALISEQHAEGRIDATDNPEQAVLDSDISLICVGTPSRTNGSLD